MSAVIQKHSPNFGPRKPGVHINCVVLHATADRDTSESVAWCCAPKSQVSYHAIIDRDGTIYSLVDVLNRAWHAGVSEFGGVPNVNDYSIGLSFANDNSGTEPYPETQLAVGAALVAGYLRRFDIPLDRVTTHRAIALPAGRKSDPAPAAFGLVSFKIRVQRELLRATP